MNKMETSREMRINTVKCTGKATSRGSNDAEDGGAKVMGPGTGGGGVVTFE